MERLYLLDIEEIFYPFIRCGRNVIGLTTYDQFSFPECSEVESWDELDPEQFSRYYLQLNMKPFQIKLPLEWYSKGGYLFGDRLFIGCMNLEDDNILEIHTNDYAPISPTISPYLAKAIFALSMNLGSGHLVEYGHRFFKEFEWVKKWWSIKEAIEVHPCFKVHPLEQRIMFIADYVRPCKIEFEVTINKTSIRGNSFNHFMDANIVLYPNTTPLRGVVICKGENRRFVINGTRLENK